MKKKFLVNKYALHYNSTVLNRYTHSERTSVANDDVIIDDKKNEEKKKYGNIHDETIVSKHITSNWFIQNYQVFPIASHL